MSAAPARGTVAGRRSRRPRRPHHKRQRRAAAARSPEPPEPEDPGEPGEKRPKVNPIFLWASQQEQRIVEVRCEDYDKRNRIKLTKTAQGWRSIPRTTIIPTTISPANRVRLDSENERNDGDRVEPDRRRYDSGEPCSDDDDGEEVENVDQEDGDAEEAATLLDQQRREHRRRLQGERNDRRVEQDQQRKNVAALRLQPRVMLEQLKPSQLSALQNETIDSNRVELPRGVVSMMEATAASPEMAPMAADTPTADLPDSQECSPRSPSLIESISYPEVSVLRPIQRRQRSRDDDISTYTNIRDDYQNIIRDDSRRSFAETEAEDQSSEDYSLDRDVLPVKMSDCNEETAFEGPRRAATPVAKSNSNSSNSDPSQHSRSIATSNERHLDDPILNALRNTPGLTVSVTSATTSRSPVPRIPASWKRPPPGLLISVPNDAKVSGAESPSTQPPIDANVCNGTIPPANRGPVTPTAIMSGLSISIPGYRYRPRPGPDSATTTSTTTTAAAAMTTEQRRRDDADSPESTTTQHRRPSSSATVDLEDSMSQGTTTTNASVLQVSPQPSGIPCSPASGRPSSASGRPGSAYLELLLPSPPCSVSCSEDAKNDLTLKGILASPSRQLLRPSSEPNGIPDSREAVAGGNFGSASPFNALALGDRRSSEALARTPTSEALHDPATELRDLLRTSGHLIPDPLLVPRDCLPALAAAPYTEIPKLLAARPELRLPQALTRPELLRDPDLLVISLAHLQHVLDHGEGPVVPELRSDPFDPDQQPRPKLTCKPIGTLMPGPIDLSATRDRSTSSQPLLRVRTTGLLKQEAEVTSTAASPEDSHLWHPLFGSQKRHHLQPFQETYFQRQHPHHHHHHHHSEENGHYQRGLRLQHRVHHQHDHQHHHHHHHPTHHREQQQYQHGHPRQQEQQQQKQCAHAPWHRTTITS